MESYKRLYALVEEYIRDHPYKGTPSGLYEPVNYSMAIGGKRVRPVLMLMSSEMFGGDTKKVLPGAVALELFHNFTLLHDDIMDKAPLRRGQATVHSKWNSNTAILSGDLMMIKSLELFVSMENSFPKEAMMLFLRTAAEVCEGQQMDMDFETEAPVCIADYLRMIELKTAVLLACALKLGAMSSGAGEENAGHLYDFGKHIGIAFQLQDDILDVFSETPEFGKQAGGDIAGNKQTYLLIKALELASGDLLKKLENLLQGPANKEKIQEVTAIYEQLQVKKYAEEEMEKHFQLASAHLQKVNLPEEKKKGLADFAAYLQQRAY